MHYLIFILFFIILHPVFSEDNCDSIQSESQRLSCYKKQWQEKDKKLNEVYQSLTKKLPAKEKEEMKLDSRSWIDRKEYYCINERYTGDANSSKKNASYYKCLLDFTESRITFLQKAFGKENISKDLVGTYSDGDGGRIEIKKGSSGYEFTMTCVRGETSHSGEVTGVIPKIKNKLTWKDSPKDTTCELEFTFSDYKIEVNEKECSVFHGARAYFSGKYRKIE
jgi:uncharacterized protein YecT (DUF1311 family)